MKEQGNDLSKRIRFLRVRKGMTQEQLASAMGLKNRDSISKIELGKQDISTQQISLLADIFDVSISYLLYGQIDKEEITLEDRDSTYKQHKYANICTSNLYFCLYLQTLADTFW